MFDGMPKVWNSILRRTTLRIQNSILRPIQVWNSISRRTTVQNSISRRTNLSPELHFEADQFKRTTKSGTPFRGRPLSLELL
ncbi:hypothetical protein RCL_jg13154.t1 [Rhizophagus clarus]|uniref:Uncharacterized protein n=1 Tax=Rhizophagus clarus TaxID=94130 RepID=A0A8H3KSJ0_9GLOM|nr:hypothetical protein RCL_jg13154.t1 [Rhizophagus clarus]